jgi:large subunit ribosomal protein L19
MNGPINIKEREKMNLNLVEQITKSQLRTDLPDFKPGYQVRVDVRIQEGNKSRIQAFEGLVIARQGKGIGESFIVRKMSSQIGVERTFPVHSPIIESITVLRRGKVRRAKLFYMRGRSGKASRLVEIR